MVYSREQFLKDNPDKTTGNFGGRIENARKNEDGSTTATVIVYFD